eukprot:jgi/Mesvir1/22787/Mv14175-RA.1
MPASGQRPPTVPLPCSDFKSETNTIKASRPPTPSTMGTTMSTCSRARTASNANMEPLFPLDHSSFPLADLAGIPGIGVRVMDCLPLLERVRLRSACREFRQLVDESLIMTTTLVGEDLAGLKKEKRTEALLWLVGKCPNLKSVATGNGQQLSLTDAGKGCHPATWLRGRGISSFMLQLSEHCRGLRSLDVSYSHGVTDEGLQAVAGSCRDLRSLKLTHCYKLTDKGVRALADSCRSLDTLDVSLCKGVTDISIRAVVSACRQLRCLKASFCEGVTDASVQAAAENCPELRQLSLAHCHRVTDASIVAVATYCGKLRLLNVGHCPDVTDAGIRAIGERCSDLARLVVEGCHHVGDGSITVLARNCHQLQHLNVGSTARLNSASAMSLGQSCSQLMCLILSNHNGYIGDAGFAAVAKGCPGLRQVYAESCRDMTDEGVIALVSHCPLTVLRLDRCGNVGDLGVAAIARHGHALEELGLEGCSGVSDASMRLVADTCRRLRLLTVGGVSGGWVTNDSLRLVADKCVELVQLSVSNTNVDDDTMGRVVQHGKLKFLDVAWCKQLSRCFFKKLGKSCTNLEVLNASGCMLTWEQLQTAMRGVPCRLLMQRAGVYVSSYPVEGLASEGREGGPS